MILQLYTQLKGGLTIHANASLCGWLSRDFIHAGVDLNPIFCDSIATMSHQLTVVCIVNPPLVDAHACMAFTICNKTF